MSEVVTREQQLALVAAKKAKPLEDAKEPFAKPPPRKRAALKRPAAAAEPVLEVGDGPVVDEDALWGEPGTGKERVEQGSKEESEEEEAVEEGCQEEEEEEEEEEPPPPKRKRASTPQAKAAGPKAKGKAKAKASSAYSKPKAKRGAKKVNKEIPASRAELAKKTFAKRFPPTCNPERFHAMVETYNRFLRDKLTNQVFCEDWHCK